MNSCTSTVQIWTIRIISTSQGPMSAKKNNQQSNSVGKTTIITDRAYFQKWIGQIFKCKKFAWKEPKRKPEKTKSRK